MRVLISYDIVMNKRRQRVMTLLKRMGLHSQRSVFECDLTSRELDVLLKSLSELIDPETDSIRAYPLCKECIRRRETFGRMVTLQSLEYRIL